MSHNHEHNVQCPTCGNDNYMTDREIDNTVRDIMASYDIKDEDVANMSFIRYPLDALSKQTLKMLIYWYARVPVPMGEGD